jgi:hypothetical protein
MAAPRYLDIGPLSVYRQKATLAGGFHAWAVKVRFGWSNLELSWYRPTNMMRSRRSTGTRIRQGRR